MSLARISSSSALESFAVTHGDSAGLDGYSPDGEREVVFPYLEANGRKAWLAFGRAMRFMNAEGKKHTVTLFYGLDDNGVDGFSVVCGDTFLGGSLKGGTAGAKARCEEAVDAAISSGAVPSGGRAALIAKMLGNLAVFPNESACNFYRLINTAGAVKAGCKHVKGLLYRLRSTADLVPVADQVKAGFEALKDPSSARTTKKSSTATETLFQRIQGLLDPKREFKVPVLVEGPPGWGKTFAARELGLHGGFDAFVEAGGHAGMEAFDFIGGYIRAGNDYPWNDGPVTRAFRLAAQGKKVLLLIDEFLRVPRRERNVFLSALAPHKDCYRLVTGRATKVVDGIAEQELIEAPIANISIVGTTNIGAAYDVESDDPALAERFFRIYAGKDLPFARLVLLQMIGDRAAANGAKWKTATVDKVMAFFTHMETLAKDNLATAEPNLRMVTRAVQMAESSAEVKDRLIDFIPTWVGRTLNGEPIPEQVDGVKMAVNRAWAA